MKHFCSPLIALLLLCRAVLASSTVHLEWNANAVAENVTSYKVWAVTPKSITGTAGAKWDVIGRTPGTDFIAGPFPSGKLQVFAISAVNNIGESAMSYPLIVRVP